MRYNKRVTKILFTLLGAYSVTASWDLGAAEEASVFDMSLQQLLESKVRVPGLMTKIALAEQPSSITTISRLELDLTPARNLLDLIEVYVPGAYWMDSEQGPLLGMRGSLVSRNSKYLLLVNGKVMNSKGYFGAKSELEQWDLADIEKVEIIRGPGSVTYGPGAVTGVINITTLTAATADKDFVAVRYNHQYNSQGASYGQRFSIGTASFYSFISATWSDGDMASQFLVDDNDELGYVGEDFLLDTMPLDYFADYHEQPQVKLHLDGQLSADWRLWLRYSQQGAHWKGNEVKSDFGGEKINQQGTRDRQWTVSLENSRQVSEKLLLSTFISADSFDGYLLFGNLRDRYRDEVLNFRQNFSETEFFVSSQLNWTFDDSLQTALQLEYSLDEYGPGWGDSVRDLRLGDNADIVNGPDSNAILADNKGSADRNGPAFFVGHGWSTDSYALVAELNKSFANQTDLILSGRFDKSSNSDWLFSPRATVNWEFSRGHFVHLLAQTSRRLNNAGQNLVESFAGEKPKSESLRNVEINYAGFFQNQHTFKTALFWNQAEILSWNGDINASLFVGDQEVAGVEIEYLYQWQNSNIGFNYSLAKQLEWELAAGLTRSGISYSDYNQLLGDTDLVMTGYGNDINNWPNHSLKSFINWQASDKLSVHASLRVLWDFQGAKDGLQALRNAVAGDPLQSEVDNALARVNQVDAYETDLRFNASLAYQFLPSFKVSLYAQNLFGSNNNRYAEDSGNDDPAPRKVRFTEESSSLGITLEWIF